MTKHKNYRYWVPVGVIATIVLAIIIGIVVAMQPLGSTVVGCTVGGASHTVTLTSARISPAQTSAIRCDTLTFTNRDDQTHVFMFGDHRTMSSFNGIEEKDLAPGESFTVTLGQTGTFSFHDHTSDQAGTFVVK